MNGLTLVLAACSLLEGNQCKEVAIPLLPEVTQMQCVVRGQVEVIAWKEAHPNWIVKRWTCAKVKDEADI